MSGADAALLTIHLAATAGMMGVIWFVQVVQYPLFAMVDTTGFAEFEGAHRRRTSLVVGPLMAIEGFCALAIVGLMRDVVGLALPLVGLALLGAIHASTLSLQLPAHMQLEEGFDQATHRRLVASNWIRTVGWTMRVGVAGWMIIVAA
ncbi:MAG: hypothetical protein AAGF73_02320 [Actinomycetota bacterium]